MNKPVAVILIFVVGFAGLAVAETPQQNIEAMEATKTALSTPSSGKANVGEALNHVMRTYDVPISFEWSFIDEDGQNIDNIGKMPFEIKVGDTLSDSLNAACSLAVKALQWRRMSGSIVVMPADGEQGIESTLDNTVTLEVQGVSTWEALCALASAVNAANATGRTLTITPLFLNDRRSGPPAFSADRSISLSLVDVAARDALLAIIDASPVFMSYRYYNFGGTGNEGSSMGSHVMVDPSLPGDSSRDYPLLDSSELFDVWMKQVEDQKSISGK